jgi:hypothetical protein
MGCKVKYLNSTGIMPREVKGVAALSSAFPSTWVMYLSLHCFPRNQDPMEIDAVLLMDDRVLILEIKDWNGDLTSSNSHWYIGKQRRQRSAVVMGEEKAKKLSTVIRSANTLAGAFYVDARVVLTGSANKSKLPQFELDRTLSLKEACSIADPVKRNALLTTRQIKLKKPYELEAEFDKVFYNTQLFQPLEADWAGYSIVEQNVFQHPNKFWADHVATRRDEDRLYAMVRVWSFNKLPVGLNSAETRRLVASRETNAFAYLEALGSPLTSENRVLREIATPDAEVSTNHFEVRQLRSGWYTLDRYLIRREDDLDLEDRKVIAATLLNLVSLLHKANVSHRDIGPRSVWIGSHTDLALTGFMSCQLPDKQTVVDWLSTLRGYAQSLPEDAAGLISSGRHRDVYATTFLVALILTGKTPPADDCEAFIASLPADLATLSDWFRRGLAHVATDRFSDASQLADTFSSLVEADNSNGFDASLLDRFETPTVPYTSWPVTGAHNVAGMKHTYSSTKENETLMVKVWMGVSRGRSVAFDCALFGLFSSVERLRDAPIAGLPYFTDFGLSPVGAFVVYRRAPGISLASATAISDGRSVEFALQVLAAVTALHDMGCAHGDISTNNVLIDFDSIQASLIDPFDVSPMGNGVLGTPDMLPKNWEYLDPFSIDRYCAIKIVCHILELEPAKTQLALKLKLQEELERPVIGSLELATSLLKQAESATNNAATCFELATEMELRGFRAGENYYIRRQNSADGARVFITSEAGQLVLEGFGTKLVNHYFRAVSFANLADESGSRQARPSVRLLVSRGPEKGFSELYSFLSGESLAGVALPATSTPNPSTSLDAASHWQRLIELEEESRVEIRVTHVIAQRDGAVICGFENLGKDFDFDDEEVVEAHLNNKRIGTVDFSASAFPSAIGLRIEKRRVMPGDYLKLAGHREQSSMERRSRAVKRILEGRSVIPNLINYFEPLGNVVSASHSLEISEQELSSYDLNQGQADAFRRVLTSGPVGLLQGPPGTGKTKFIASLVHWLVTKGNCRRVLIASQSHEAVNNAIDALLLLHKRKGDRPSLLRIGSKGITERIRPYHSTELRERYRVRFEAASRYRYLQLTNALGIDKVFAGKLFDLDRQVGVLARRLVSVQEALSEDGQQLAVDKEKNRVQIARVVEAYRVAFRAFEQRDPDPAVPIVEYDWLVDELTKKYPLISPADLRAARRALTLTNDWLSSLGSLGRNFEEFLAKTRSIVSATCVGVGQTRIRIDAQVFDWVIVDEAARCTSGELAVPLQMARRVLLVGDHLQLRPMIENEIIEQLQDTTQGATEEELRMSDFERAFDSPYGTLVGLRFTEQYRMDEAICAMVSKCFYEPKKIKLTTSPQRSPRLTRADVAIKWLVTPMVWIDTHKAANCADQRYVDETSFSNVGEVQTVMSILQKIAGDTGLLAKLSMHDDETPIGVICMYGEQKRMLESAWDRHPWDAKFRRMVRIDTVDGYQGKENEIVIVSLVRNNDKGRVGHAGEANRCNVSVSRARERLIIVGDATMWGARVPAASPMRRVFDYMRSDQVNSKLISAGDLE